LRELRFQSRRLDDLRARHALKSTPVLTEVRVPDRLRTFGMARNADQLSLKLVQADDSGRRPTKTPTSRGLSRLSISPREAAQMLGVSRDFFDEHVKPELRIIRRGSKTILIPIAELERWVDESAARWAS